MGIFSAEDSSKIIHAIAIAENQTSGEIRLAVERKCPTPEPLTRAAQYFEELQMHKTRERNGVLIYMAVDDHVFSIIGDEGIHRRVPPHFWNETKEEMIGLFRQGQLCEGLITGILHAGEQLRRHFPCSKDDINELPNEIVYGNV